MHIVVRESVKYFYEEDITQTWIFTRKFVNALKYYIICILITGFPIFEAKKASISWPKLMLKFKIETMSKSFKNY